MELKCQAQSARPVVEPPSLSPPRTWPQAHQSSGKARKALALLLAPKTNVSLVNVQRCHAGSLALQSSAAKEAVPKRLRFSSLRCRAGSLVHLSSAAPHAAHKKLRFSPLRFSGNYYANTSVLSGMFGRSRQARSTCVESPGIEDVNIHPLLPPNLTLKRNANSVARRPSSAGPCGPFCACCPARHAAGVRLALR